MGGSLLSQVTETKPTDAGVTMSFAGHHCYDRVNADVTSVRLDRGTRTTVNIFDLRNLIVAAKRILPTCPTK